MSEKKAGRDKMPYSISQNFLTSKKTIDRLIRLTSIEQKDEVLEIGAGKGHITKALAGKANRVTAYEIDTKLYAGLQRSFKDETKVTIVNQDFLKASMPKKSYKIFSNIPFCITTDILRKIICGSNPVQEAWLIMEKGAAKRFCGYPGENLMSLQMKPFYDLRIEYYFKKTDFHPMPSVEVVLLHMKKKKQPDIKREEKAAYLNFIRHTIKYGFYGKKSLLTSRQISQALRFAGLPQIERSGMILYVQWLCLFRYFFKYTGFFCVKFEKYY